MSDLILTQNEDGGMTFNFNGHEIRALIRDGEPRFALKDAADALGIANHRDIFNRLEDYEKGVDTIDTLGGPQQIQTVTEAGLYSMIGNSRKPEAKAFKFWVNSVVLPSIRKHGVYATDDVVDQMLDDPDFGIQLLTRVKNERAKRKAAEQQLIAEKERSRELTNTNEKLQVALDISNDMMTLRKYNAIKGWEYSKGELSAHSTRMGHMGTYRVGVQVPEYKNALWSYHTSDIDKFYEEWRKDPSHLSKVEKARLAKESEDELK